MKKKKKKKKKKNYSKIVNTLGCKLWLHSWRCLQNLRWIYRYINLSAKLWSLAIQCFVKFHWPQYMDSWLARFCILVNACHRKSLGGHFTPVKKLDRHTDFCTCQCMKCNRWQVFSFKFHENSGKKNGKVPQIFKTLKYLLKIAKRICWC